MTAPDPERRIGIRDNQAELDRFENQAAAILFLALVLTGVIDTILIQVLF